MSDTELIVRDRGTGRTTLLIEWAAAEPATPGPMRYIVCHSSREATRVFHEARRMGHEIAFPVTWDEAQRMLRAHRDVELAVDNLEMIVKRILEPHTVKMVVW